ncbi:tetratricopeptide repeat protein [Paraliomyxa miuraensis]|uniref:tetratricopeptide repeat protein n=1 Tax=Paraliomyxa miuraensis TaxID=376150 RepID=UPI00224D25F3|nr:tetratricopeptide repeat protein [Paraliomyxa miuraensis]MCX4243510.1 tetratricopeptide repeat protein [Paraliomyxa miuraensis]
MQPHLVELPLVRAHLHFAHARYPQAIGAFRAAMGIDPTFVGAHLGLAESLAALGRRGEAVEGLVRAAETFESRDEHEDALSLLGKALAIDPSRMELDVDLAMIEEAMGRHEAAVARVEGLADRYMDAGRTEEAAELLRFLMSWEDQEPVEAPAAPEHPAVAAEAIAPQATPVHTALITGHTVIARNPLLHMLELLPAATVPEAPAADAQTVVHRVPSAPIVLAVDHEPEVDLDMVTRVAASRPNPVVDRLRARAGLGASAGHPRRVPARPTEPIAINRGLRGIRPEQEEDVTLRFRRPRALDVAI